MPCFSRHVGCRANGSCQKGYDATCGSLDETLISVIVPICSDCFVDWGANWPDRTGVVGFDGPSKNGDGLIDPDGMVW